MTELRLDSLPSEGLRLDGRPFGAGFTGTLGLVLTEVESDRARAWADVGPAQHQETGIVHGGWYATVVETVASLGAYRAVSTRGQTVVGVSNTTEFFRPVRTGRIEVVARPVHQGRTQQVWEVHITRASDDKLVARGQLRMQNVEQRAAQPAGNGSTPG